MSLSPEQIERSLPRLFERSRAARRSYRRYRREAALRCDHNSPLDLMYSLQSLLDVIAVRETVALWLEVVVSLLRIEGD